MEKQQIELRKAIELFFNGPSKPTWDEWLNKNSHLILYHKDGYDMSFLNDRPLKY